LLEECLKVVLKVPVVGEALSRNSACRSCGASNEGSDRPSGASIRTARRSIEKYRAALGAFGTPDPIRVRYREALGEVIRRVVAGGEISLARGAKDSKKPWITCRSTFRRRSRNTLICRTNYQPSDPPPRRHRGATKDKHGKSGQYANPAYAKRSPIDSPITDGDNAASLIYYGCTRAQYWSQEYGNHR